MDELPRKRVPGVSTAGVAFRQAVNDLHIWETGSEQKLLSAHIKSGEETPNDEGIIRAAREMLVHKCGINHATLQILPIKAGGLAHCNHCN